jgi:hypothetical protein
MESISFDVTVRVTRHPARSDMQDEVLCPACDSELRIHQPEEETPHRLLGTCTCGECGLWFVLIPTPDRECVYLVRIPIIAEFREALSRQGLL